MKAIVKHIESLQIINTGFDLEISPVLSDNVNCFKLEHDDTININSSLSDILKKVIGAEYICYKEDNLGVIQVNIDDCECIKHYYEIYNYHDFVGVKGLILDNVKKYRNGKLIRNYDLSMKLNVINDFVLNPSEELDEIMDNVLDIYFDDCTEVTNYDYTIVGIRDNTKYVAEFKKIMRLL